MTPEPPDWLTHRPHLAKTYLHPQARTQEAPEARPPPFNTLKEEDKELVLCEDLLNALLGFEGQYISASTKEIATLMVSFHVDRDVDAPLAELVARHLPLCDHHHYVARYIAQYSLYPCGQVAQAFAAAADAVVKEYMILVCKLEEQVRRQQGFLLQSLWYHLQPAAHTMEALFKICHFADVGRNTGGGLLQVLYQNSKEVAGDAHHAALAAFLLERAAAPYFAQLEAWLTHGRLQDPAHEFLVAEQPHFRCDERTLDYIDKYWEQRYVARDAMLPEFLRPYSRQILTTGKYLNVIRECGRDVNGGTPAPPRQYGARVEAAYGAACERLLTLVREELQLAQRLTSLKHYFFLDRGDLFTHLIDVAEAELVRPCEEINGTKLEALVELAVRSSTTGHDPFHADVAGELLPVTLAKSLRLARPGDAGHAAMAPKPSSGHEAFALTYRVGWPLSLIVSPRALWMYQSMFRHLFKCKWVERLLCGTLISSRQTRQSPDRALFARCFLLRQRMLQFLQNFQYYMTFEVVEPSWQEMVGKIQTATNVDEIMAHHTAFLTHCMDAFLLNSSHLFKTVQALLTSCIVFSEWVPKSVEARRSPIDPSKGSATRDMLSTTMVQFEQQFDHRLRDLLQQLSTRGPDRSPAPDPHLRRLIQRLDFNGYYLQRQFYRADMETA